MANFSLLSEGSGKPETEEVAGTSRQEDIAVLERRKKVKQQPDHCVLVTGFKTIDGVKETLQ